MIKSETITSDNIADGTITMPKLTLSQSNGGLSFAYPLGDVASNGDIITLSGVDIGTSVQINDSLIDVVSYSNTTTLTFEAPPLPAGSYIARIIRPNGQFMMLTINYA